MVETFDMHRGGRGEAQRGAGERSGRSTSARSPGASGPSRISWLRDLRRLAREDETRVTRELTEAGARQVRSAIAWARVFPSDVALTLAERAPEAGPASISPDAFEAALRDAGLEAGRIGVERARFERLRELAEASDGEVTGLDVDLGSALEPDDRRALAEAGVETLGDWVALRDRVEVTGPARERLDAQARLRALGVWGERAADLVSAGQRSALDLARLSPDEIGDLSRRLGMPRDELERLVMEAEVRAWASQQQIGVLRFTAPQDQPGWWRQAFDGLTDWSPGKLVCTPCSPDDSVFSKFAYYVYLVKLTGRTLDELENSLHQPFASLSPADGRNPEPQVMLCAEILARAFPGPLSAEVQWQVERRQIVAGLLLAGETPGEVAARAAANLPGSDLDDLATRLRQVLTRRQPESQAVFSAEELQALTQQLDALIETRVRAEVTSEPANLGMSSAEVDGEVSRRMAALLLPAEVDAAITIRDALRARSGRSDRQLYQQLFLETDLGGCEQMTRLDLAIRALQGYLDQQLRQPPPLDPLNPQLPQPYLEYEAWRGEVMGQYYPELRALWRDDVLTATASPQAREPWDRGSFIFNRATTRAELQQQLAAAEDALKQARVAEVAEDGDEDDLPQNDAAVRGLDRFRERHPRVHAEFEAGLRAIRSVLVADDEVQSALGWLDKDQPGVALSDLEQAAQRLDAMAELVFQPGSAWRQPPGLPPARFADLITLPPAVRRARLEQLFEALMVRPKRLFTSANVDVEVAGLSASGGIANLSAWQQDGSHFSAQGGRIVKASSGAAAATTIRQVRYRGPDSAAGSGGAQDPQTFANYTLQADFVLDEGLESGERLGIGVRMGADGQSGYRLLVSFEMQEYAEDEVGWTYYLDLEKLDSGVPSRLRRVQLDTGGGLRQVGGLSILPGQRYTLTLTAHEGALKGQVSSAEQAVSIDETEDTASPRLQGTFALLASDGVAAEFSNLRFEIAGKTGHPPFYAPRRASRLQELDAGAYSDHRSSGRGMGRQDLPRQLSRPAGGATSVELVGAKGGGGHQLYLAFESGEAVVDLDALDELLDRCLAAAFYLRFAVLPVRMAQAHLRAGDPQRAAELLRVLYDDDAPTEPERAIYPRFFRPTVLFMLPLVGPDARVMRLRLAEAYLAWAEHLFRRDDENARYQARQLCRRVLALHAEPGLQLCPDLIGEVTDELVLSIVEAPFNQPADGRLGLAAGGRGRAAAELIGMVVGAQNLAVDLGALRNGGAPRSDGRDLLTRTRRRLEAEVTAYHDRQRGAGSLVRRQERAEALLREAELRLGLPGGEPAPPAGPGPRPPGPGPGPQPGSPEVPGGMPEPDPDRPGDFAPGDVQFPDLVSTVELTFCVPPNPLARQQQAVANQMLELLKLCRNVLGLQDDLVPPFRFEALLRLARGFTDLAQEAERDLLQIRQAAEQDSYSLLQAEASLALSEADLRLEAMNVDLAVGDLAMAELQVDQVQSAVNYYDGLIRDGLLSSEQLALDAANVAVAFSAYTAALSVPAIAIEAAGRSPGGITQALQGGTGSIAAAAQAISQAASLQASYQRREQEWRFQLQQSLAGAALAQQSALQAGRRVAIAVERQQVAAQRRDLNADGVQFLHGKFLNAAMYLWLQRALREQYRTRLNYATTAAYLAERALAFEVQNRNLDVIRFDYFDPRRDGLLGATRLETDLATLENTRLALTRRRLQLSRTISLATSLPAEFYRFKQGSGRLPFSTLLGWFDRDYPGHYLRLIKSVRVSVVALVPPHEGIRAHLTNSGLSRVVVGPPFADRFREETIRRNPETVALSAPFQASGLFVLNYEDDLLLPFEGSGVATDWVFELPRAANPFDFDTIADVLVTLEYTALHSEEYRAQVVQQIGQTFQADNPFSFRHKLADQWYDLHNPDLTPAGRQRMEVTFDILARDFPANVADPKIQEVSLYLALRGGRQGSLGRVDLYQEDATTPSPVGGQITVGDLFATTRNGGATAWQPLRGRSPIGRWRLRLADAEDMFRRDEVEDLLLIISFAGQTVAWPT